MPRVSRGVTNRRRHNKVLKLTRGHRGSRHLLFRRAKESLIKGLSHAYRHRRERKREFRSLWITRIGAAARQAGLSYSALIHGLELASVEVDRKTLADMAVRDPNGFSHLASVARQHLETS